MAKKRVGAMKGVTLEQLLRAVREFRKKAKTVALYKRALESTNEMIRHFEGA